MNLCSSSLTDFYTEDGAVSSSETRNITLQHISDLAQAVIPFYLGSSRFESRSQDTKYPKICLWISSVTPGVGHTLNYVMTASIHIFFRSIIH